MKILIVDGQGGGIGRQLAEALKRAGEQDVTCVGTNAIATAAMLKAGAAHAATGENAVVVACREADVVAGPLGHARNGRGHCPKPRPQGAYPRQPVRELCGGRSCGRNHGQPGGKGR